MKGLAFDVSHMLAGGLVLTSFLLLYQNRLYALLNMYSLQAVVLSLSVAWQAFVQDASHLYVTALIALVFKAIVIPLTLHKIIAELEAGRVPWVQPWGTAAANAAIAMPRNAATGRRYSGASGGATDRDL